MGWKKNKIDTNMPKNRHIYNLLKYKYLLFNKLSAEGSFVQNYTNFLS